MLNKRFLSCARWGRSGLVAQLRGLRDPGSKHDFTKRSVVYVGRVNSKICRRGTNSLLLVWCGRLAMGMSAQVSFPKSENGSKLRGPSPFVINSPLNVSITN
ncbi:hypothetical protein AVEN_210562-1 [Araneus ventricosus]|uniref:Uncharacterized protein n=1 Tax=Araneus ventricosus TaxID=182803 RepID=A0A4Y2VZP6_ARAVE|nr:hypothetical protein AVEN_210562-1 [Araneus ventricosus]